MSSAPQTITQKILARASGRTMVQPGDILHPEPELVIVHDGYVETVYRELRTLGYGRIASPDKVMFVTDHEVLYGSPKAAARGAHIRKIAREWGINQFYDVGQGGHGHIFPIEQGLVRPGMFLFAYDMHCTNFGALGAVAIGVGPEISTVLATGTVWTQVPETIRVVLHGGLAPGVHARDVGFVLAHGLSSNRWGVSPDYRVIEFDGPALRTLSLAAKVALCNSITEIGVANVVFPPPPGQHINAVSSDPGASFLHTIEINLDDISAQIALPGGPDRAVDLNTVLGRKIDHAFLGSCGSGMYEDFIDAASVIQGRRVASGVRFFVVPGTVATAARLLNDGIQQIFLEAGAIFLPPGCGPCAGGMMAPLSDGEVSISTAATNHSGRFGSPGGQAYLASPLTVAASAVSGVIAASGQPAR
ncbi:MAG TPA: aconitase family protein [Eoetvoesiella sp.]